MTAHKVRFEAIKTFKQKKAAHRLLFCWENTRFSGANKYTAKNVLSVPSFSLYTVEVILCREADAAPGLVFGHRISSLNSEKCLRFRKSKLNKTL